ncbi:hypothetical protein LBMAG52_16260 [Planctomycetia bacterium]|nr:hypothetical protein LBMAG52_16260 [Planctomycetia bacterium]
MKLPLLPVIFAALTALFWGMYGPAIGFARTAEGNNPFKPYVMIGVAYLIWASLVGVGGMIYTKAPFTFSGAGVTWGFIGGSLGAFGALTLTLAMFSFEGKPKPELVMPIVFGGAVTVNAFTNLVLGWKQGSSHETSPWLWVGMIGVAASIVVVAVFTPHVGPKMKPAAPTSNSAPAESPKSQS